MPNSPQNQPSVTARGKRKSGLLRAVIITVAAIAATAVATYALLNLFAFLEASG
jgi:hypothetical protein